MEELQKQNEILNQRLEKAKEVFKDQKAQLEAKNAKIAELDAEVEKYSKAAKEAERRATELETKWNDQIAENDETADKLAEVNAEVAKCKEALVNKDKSLADNQQIIECLTQKNAELDKAFAKMKDDYADLSNKFKELTVVHNTTKEELDKMKSANAQLKQAVNNALLGEDCDEFETGDMSALELLSCL